jgi:dTDP-4-dehydrorhamnose 3,5-epimerase
MGVTLTEENGLAVYVPEGCAHGYLTLVDAVEVTYLASVPYAPGAARGVRFDDPAFAIEWPANVEVLSAGDRSWPDFAVEQG